MTEDEKQALAIYELIVATSKDRPMAFQTIEQMHRETAVWKATNPAFATLDRAEPQVLMAFLAQSFDCLRAEAHLAKNYSACNTLAEGIQIALERAPKPLPGELVSRLFDEYCGSMGEMAHMYFPIRLLISSISEDQVTEGIRSELRKLHLHLAPSASGKIEPETREFRDQIAELIRMEGERQLDPGRGPWLQIAPKCSAVRRNADIERSTTVTFAPIPTAMRAVFEPTIPAPSMRMSAGGTPGTPPNKMPRPPCPFSRQAAPTCGAMRPATSDMGVKSGKEPSGAVTVSYAMQVAPLRCRSRVCSGSGAK
jgi:hypothetical protein